MDFQLQGGLLPKGDQPKAIEGLVKGLKQGYGRQVLLGVTGSGKTFTMASVIEKAKRPSLILAHNKTLAAQLYQEFKALFPSNRVEYFVSYYDYYQPEAYIARTDTYIEKDLAINEQIERLRLSATKSLVERRDCIIVSSVSCIYGLGLPEHYLALQTRLQVGGQIARKELLARLVDMQYERAEDLSHGHFRVRGDTIEVYPSYEEDRAYRIELFDTDIERISLIDPLTGALKERLEEIVFYPSSHHVIPEDIRLKALETIERELESRVKFFEEKNLWLERERILQRTRHDMDMIRQIGHCKGIENYSRHFSGRKEKEAPACLLDYFPEDFITFIDESHQTLPQIHAMYNGDRARKTALVEYGFRLPSAYDNRPLKFEEFDQKIGQVIFVSATPGSWELSQAKGRIVEQIVRPTGLVDPLIELRSAKHQVDDVIGEISLEIKKGTRVLVTTLTKKMAEELSGYLKELNIKSKYLHSEIETLERLQILNDLRLGTFDVLVGINLLREGLDMPEVSLVAILDADKEGFLRSATALIQTCGRAARNVQGRVIMYGDKVTESMKKCIDETQRRREQQIAYNKVHGITPSTTERRATTTTGFEEALKALDTTKEDGKRQKVTPPGFEALSSQELDKKIEEMRLAMKRAAKEFRFEEAANFRDRMHEYQRLRLMQD